MQKIDLYLYIILINNIFTMDNTETGTGTITRTGGTSTITNADNTERKALLTKAINTLAQFIKDEEQRLDDEYYKQLKEKATAHSKKRELINAERHAVNKDTKYELLNHTAFVRRNSI